MERGEQNSLQMLQIVCIFLEALSPRCLGYCASRLHSVKQFLMFSYYWNRGATLHTGFTGIKSILRLNLGTESYAERDFL